jgi:hypothetical protein
VTIAVRPTRIVVVREAAPASPVAPQRASFFTRKLAWATPPPPASAGRQPGHARAVHRRRRTANPSRPSTTPSLYERTADRVTLRAQGCRAGRARTAGIVILDFGKPAFAHHTYGTLMFSHRFASNTAISWALKSYARGYVECRPTRAKARITLVRGTSNYHLWNIPSGVTAGRLWAEETAAFGLYLRRHHLDAQVKAAAGDDAEPAWDRTFQRTYNFFRGFRSAHTGYLLYNYGSLDGGPGQIWTLQQAYYVAAGMRYARAVPEIYNQTMAKQWALLSRLSAERYGKPVPFAGLMTQHSKHCRFGCYTPSQAHQALVHELAKSPKTRVRMLATVTNIAAPAPTQAARAR